ILPLRTDAARAEASRRAVADRGRPRNLGEALPARAKIRKQLARREVAVDENAELIGLHRERAEQRLVPHALAKIEQAGAAGDRGRDDRLSEEPEREQLAERDELMAARERLGIDAAKPGELRGNVGGMERTSGALTSALEILLVAQPRRVFGAAHVHP